ncbi:PQQ-binding-like beta-propeller repeat protein [Haloarcula sp. NS06]|uniref:PQQ-binding-like beta-propeller repeat protein n=1 Tax=unclassified Haloarcula TaxID=2624677 RepID=UPI0027B1122D|nr:PQQ-binding-like beta-propeller repeat protein [Haloarcula sp. H-GB4]MDQ2072580.1 PQQ-like beta-propeller repeat protein [Haloarcula sp. H-GB4]
MTEYSRRTVLTGLTGVVGSLAGCGYRPGPGDKKWETADDGGRLVTLVDETLFEVTFDATRFLDDYPVGAVARYTLADGARLGRFEFKGVATDWASDGAHLYVGTEASRVVAVAGDGRAWTETVDHPVASVAAADGHVYVGTDGGDLIAFDGESGAERWSKSLPVPADPSKSDLPTVGAGHGGLAVDWGTSEEYRLNVYAPDGSVLWDQTLQRSLNGRPHVRGDTVYARSEYLQAFNRDSGTRRWVTEDITTPDGPLWFSRDGEIVYIPDRNALIAIATADGEELWRFNDERLAAMERGRSEFDIDLGATGAVPAPDGGSVFLNTKHHGLFQFGTDGTLRWHEPRLDFSFLYAVTEDTIVHSGTEALVARYR